ncbi:YheC/YheD family protein [Parageobacillus sp. VR-IP]|uniref:YheC/YheD family endospore coat-associated protein n=1 Tax=Parageobacillus sp. VR-IP TaxID=2742205 RepID=UPI001583C9DD|nr:YheC/YheD family protein [Parageobacillus sp. VR-IP]NUK28640.1 YheC/YheD family protein [Parageobacillus sp. VR-IP]
MTVIYYNQDRGAWFHQDHGRAYSFGCNGLLPFSDDTPSFSLPVKEKNGKIGPLVGIMVSESSIPVLLNRKKRYIELIVHCLQKAGGIGVVCPVNAIGEHAIRGYVFVPALDRWVPVTAPLPDVFYNRIKSRQEEKSTVFQQTVARFGNLCIPFFNRTFFTKWEIYETLVKNERLRAHLPHTVPVQHIDDIQNMLKTYGSVYMKPNDGAKGKGIFRLTASLLPNTILYEHINGKKTLASLDELAPLLAATRYIAQQAIDADTWNGQRYDLRVLVHYKHGRYIISGIGVRLAQTQQLTTHVLNGGTILPYSEVRERVDEKELHSLLDACGKEISGRFGFVGEFSADIGVGKDGTLYVYELNAKPMIFDEPDIQQNGAKQLISLFAELAGFAPS